jgi:hypothetical protein
MRTPAGSNTGRALPARPLWSVVARAVLCNRSNVTQVKGAVNFQDAMPQCVQERLCAARRRRAARDASHWVRSSPPAPHRGQGAALLVRSLALAFAGPDKRGEGRGQSAPLGGEAGPGADHRGVGPVIRGRRRPAMGVERGPNGPPTSSSRRKAARPPEPPRIALAEIALASAAAGIAFDAGRPSSAAAGLRTIPCRDVAGPGPGRAAL